MAYGCAGSSPAFRTKHNQSPGYRGFVVSGASERHAGLVPGSLSAIRGLRDPPTSCWRPHQTSKGLLYQEPFSFRERANGTRD